MAMINSNNMVVINSKATISSTLLRASRMAAMTSITRITALILQTKAATLHLRHILPTRLPLTSLLPDSKNTVLLHQEDLTKAMILTVGTLPTHPLRINNTLLRDKAMVNPTSQTNMEIQMLPQEAPVKASAVLDPHS